MNTGRSGMVGVSLALVLAFVAPTWATAHAVLLRSIPPTRQTLAGAPAQVQLLFSEPIDPAFSAVRVFDDADQRVDRNDGRVDPTDDHQLVVSLLPGLPNGIYTVSWRSLSTIDVHPDDGEYALYVGVPVPTGAPAATANLPTATPETTLGRWWFYLAASLFGGVLATWKLVISNALVGVHADSRAAAGRIAYRLVIVGGVLLTLGTAYTAIAQAAAAAGVPLTETVGRPLADLLLRGRFASIWWPRLALEVISLLLVALGGVEGLAAECALATLPAVLLTSSLTSHGAALQGASAAGIVVDWLHILGAAAWVGGLMSLLVLVPVVSRVEGSRGEDIVPRLIARFGRFGLITAGVVLMSGVVQASIEVGSWSGLLDSLYGQLVLVKAGLLLAMLGLAALNQWTARSSSGAGVAALRGGVRAELLLGLVALITAAVLTGTPPTRGSL